MPPRSLDNLNQDFDKGQTDLSRIVEVLAARAEKFSTAGNYLRVAIILLGALAVTRETADKIVPTLSQNWVIGSYAAIGVLTTVVGGVLAAFKFDTRGAELKVLAAESQAAQEKLKTQWNKVLYQEDPQKQIEQAMQALDDQDNKTEEVLRKASAFTNITRKIVREQNGTSKPWWKFFA